MRRLTLFFCDLIVNVIVLALAPLLVVAWIVRVHTIERLQARRAAPALRNSENRSTSTWRCAEVRRDRARRDAILCPEKRGENATPG